MDKVRALAKGLVAEGLWYHCAALRRSVVRSALLAVVAIVLFAGPVFAQSVKPSPAVTIQTKVKTTPPPWTFYMAIVTIGIAGLTLMMVALGYLVQAPGFRRKQAPASTSGPAS